MHRSVRARLGTAALLVSALGLVAPAAAPASAAPAAHHATARAAAHHMPTLTFHINKAGKIKLVHGPKTFRPGRVAFKVTSQSQSASLAFARFGKGYSFRGFRKDIATAFGQGKMKSLKHAIKHSTFLGGVGSVGPRAVTGTVMFAKAGAYSVYNFGGNLPKSPLTLHAVGRTQHRTAPKTTGTLTALNGIRFGGAQTIPRRGTLLLKNRATDSPHFFDLFQVQPGTTKQDVLNALQTNQQGPMIAPGPMSEVIGSHQAMTLNYHVPAGSYALVCFFPDPNMHGMPHAMMGMIRMLTAK
jgi:hypothetical protein